LCVCVCVCFIGVLLIYTGFPGDSRVTCQRMRCGFNTWMGKIHWRRRWQPTPAFLAGKSHRGAWQAAVDGVARRVNSMVIQLYVYLFFFPSGFDCCGFVLKIVIGYWLLSSAFIPVTEPNVFFLLCYYGEYANLSFLDSWDDPNLIMRLHL